MKIYAAISDHIDHGVVWLKIPGLPSRAIVKITNPKSMRSVYCEMLQIESNFLEIYNQSPRFTITNADSSIVMGAWYRASLGGLETQHEYPLRVKSMDCSWGKVRACMDHPQIVVRVAVWLGVLGVLLGAIGVALGVIGVWPKA